MGCEHCLDARARLAANGRKPRGGVLDVDGEGRGRMPDALAAVVLVGRQPALRYRFLLHQRLDAAYVRDGLLGIVRQLCGRRLA